MIPVMCRVAVLILASFALASLGEHGLATVLPRQLSSLQGPLESPKPGTVVTTIAGSGAAGIQDGVAAVGEFLEPTGVSFDSEGRLFIADRAAQRIRRLWKGRLITIAGAGPILPGGHVAGGYADGPAAVARFNEPTDVVAMPDGSILVTDFLNHCIRKIKNGIVSTLAGSAASSGSEDGPAAQARFLNPIAITADHAGVVYVADYLNGIRRIDNNGNVTTIPVPGPVAKGYVGIGASGSGSSLTLFITIHGAGLEVIRPADNFAKRWPTAEPEVVLDNARGVAALNDDEALITDVEANVVRLGYAPEPPAWGHAMAHVLVGSPNGVAGMRDGPANVAEFDRPVGIAVHGRDVAVADAGNRRIREFALPDVRRPLTVSRLDELSDESHYRIVLLGASQVYYGSTPETSIGGLLEAQLNRDRRQVGLAKPVRVWTARLDGLRLDAAFSWLQTFIQEGQADLVIVAVTSGPGLADPSLNARTAARRRATFQIRQIADLLKSRHIGFFGLAWPTFAWASPSETIVFRERQDDKVYQNDIAGGVESDHGLKLAFVAANVAFAAPFDELLQEEAKPYRQPFAFADDPHPNDLGNAFVARELARGLERVKPWSNKKP